MLAVRKNFVELFGLNQTLYDFVGSPSSLKHLQGHLGVVLTDDVTETVAHGKLVLLDPLLDKLGFSSHKNGFCKLDGLDLV